MNEGKMALRRHRMAEEQIVSRGISDENVLDAMRVVERHRFVPSAFHESAYADHPLPIGDEQTISQPYIVALMSELLRVSPGDKVLEIGLGSGYQAAILAEMGLQVYAMEIIPSLAERPRQLLREMGYRVQVRVGDGYHGWPSAAPFAAMMITSAPPRIPPLLIGQLAPGGRLVLPIGTVSQELVVVTRTADGFAQQPIIPVRFVPMTGKIRQEEHHG